MIVTRRIPLVLVPMLVLLTFLGHLCELPTGSLEVAHAHEDAHDSGHHDGANADQYECDPLLGVRSTAHASSAPGLALHATRPVDVSAVALDPVEALPPVHARQQRSRLFLLYSALLI